MTDTRTLDTSQLGPIRVDPVSSPMSRRARSLYADAVASRGPGYRNAADSIRSGGYGNIWIEAALAAIENALKTGYGDDE